jgi:hypothetical protein
MHTKLALSVVIAFSALLFGCAAGDRTTDFCFTICECAPDDEVGICTNQCVQSVDSLGPSSTGGPIISDACFACANNSTCDLALSVCTNECSELFNAFDQQQQQAPQPGVPFDTN